MRRGELLGLEWKDIDLGTGVIHIQRTSYYTKQRGLYADTPKTETSKRFIKVAAVVIELLKTYKAEQGKERVKLGSQWIDTDRLFTSWNGSALGVNSPYNWLKRFCKSNKFPFYVIHQFRHLYASFLIGLGIDPTTVSGVLGHSQVSTSLNIYIHAFAENRIKAFDAVAEALDFTKHGSA